jgi:hypothetical protein
MIHLSHRLAAWQFCNDVWGRKMTLIHMVCPECSGNLLLGMGQFPQSSAHDGDNYQVRCPICASEFLIGYISEFKKVEPIDQPEDAREDGQPTDDSHGSGGGLSTRPSPNDQRSDALNPNNPAHDAVADNHSNQMNPNNPAYRSSRS